jgi:hypothetical protein
MKSHKNRNQYFLMFLLEDGRIRMPQRIGIRVALNLRIRIRNIGRRSSLLLWIRQKTYGVQEWYGPLLG